jgi:ATP-dependent Clp protease protease subunit
MNITEIRNDEEEPVKMPEMMFDQSINKKFLDERKIFLWGTVNDKTSQDLVKKLLYLEMLDPDKEITLYINSPGGIITSGMAIFDAMHFIKPQVATICVGLAASMGAILLLAGAKGKRSAWKHSRILIHQPLISGQIVAPAIDIKIQAEEINKTRKELNRIISEKTGQSIEKIENDTDRDYYMNSEEAKAYGLIDQVIG